MNPELKTQDFLCLNPLKSLINSVIWLVLLIVSLINSLYFILV